MLILVEAMVGLAAALVVLVLVFSAARDADKMLRRYDKGER